MSVTIVTCLYDIRKKEASSSNTITLIDKYLELSKHMLSVNLPMILFTDEDHIAEHIYKTRLEYGLVEKTVVVRLPFELTFFYKDLDILSQRMEEFIIGNWNKEKDTPLYVLLNNNKFDFLTRAIELNQFQTDYFMWMDMGIQHCTKATPEEWAEVADKWPSKITQDTEHIHQLRIHTVKKPDDMSWKDYFKMIYHHVAGGCFGGHKDRVLEYAQLFKDLWHQIIYDELWWQLDEALMTIITEQHPEKFNFFYGDYDGLITNFMSSKKSYILILQTAKRYIEAHRYDLATKVLDTLDYYYLVYVHVNEHQYLQQAIDLRIRNDYFGKGGHLDPVLADALCQDDFPLNILQSQIPNLSHMKDAGTSRLFSRWILRNPENAWCVEKLQNSKDFLWIGLEKCSKERLPPLDFELPFDTLEDKPSLLLGHFHSQFSFFSEESICSLYKLLEKGSNIMFLWNTLSSLGDEQINHEEYDRSLVKIAEFIKRNFPRLKWKMIGLFINRRWTVPVEQTPQELLPFSFQVPYCYKGNRSLYHSAIEQFVDKVKTCF